ncbi:MAG: M15 family peptidase [Mesorhizobium sp.]|nr:MAG: M15 family peptidase [Mesorhizobium sp.]
MANLSDRVPIPPRDAMNVGLSACREQTMLTKFGKPGQLTSDCSDPVGDFVKRVKRKFDCGPFKVSGLDFAVESLKQVFEEVKISQPSVFSSVKNDGMLCVRHRRHNPARFSNHSWGTAIDIFFGSTGPVPQGLHLTHRGNLLLAPFFNRHGWYWGAGFSGDSVDSMHFELADETILKIPDEPL